MLVDITYVDVAGVGGVDGTVGCFDCKLFCFILVGGTLYCMVVPDGIVMVWGCGNWDGMLMLCC